MLTPAPYPRQSRGARKLENRGLRGGRAVRFTDRENPGVLCRTPGPGRTRAPVKFVQARSSKINP